MEFLGGEVLPPFLFLSFQTLSSACLWGSLGLWLEKRLDSNYPLGWLIIKSIRARASQPPL